MKAKKKIFQFGRIIPGLEIHGKPAPYPVVNERSARAGAGIMLLLGIVAFMFAFFMKEYIAINIIVIAFLVEFGIRMVNPEIAPFYALGAFIVKKQIPEWSGATQKRFAWGLGLGMAVTVFLLIYVFGIRGPVNFAFCMVCLGLMWFESAFGICIGCKMYYGLVNLNIIKKPEIAPACPGGVCQLPKR